MSKLDVAKKHYSKLKAISKITNIPSEIRNFFSEKRRSIVMDTFMRLLESLNLDNRSLGGLKRENCQLTNLQVFQILLLLPFFAIKGFSHYDGSALCRMFGGKKDVLFSYHGEKGKIGGKEQGLTSEQRNGRYERKRDKKCHIAKRKEEYFMSKGVKLLDMVKDAIRNKIHFDYLLVDSWFTCTELVDFVYRRHKKFHLLGMAKMDNTKYMTTNWGGELSAKAIITKLKAKKKVKYSRHYRCHYAEIEVVLGKRAVKLFFCKRGKKEAWKVLLTTDLRLRFMRAYEIYAMRRSIEVFFSDSKRLLGLADCSSRNFSAHIAHVSLIMIRYNILASIKRTLDYDTIGGLFGDMYLGVHELTVVEKIWAIIIEVVAVVSELIDADSDELTIQIIENDKRLSALREYAQTA